MKKIILASSSPRRRDILEKTGLEFEIIPSDYEENLEDLNFTYEKIENLAYNKAKAVVATLKYSALVIGADTVVVLNDKILGKPKDKGDAIDTLQQLSGRLHSVVTSICVINSESFEQKILSTTSCVEFEHLTNEQIRHYVEKYNPLDKAGSYGIQELPDGFIKNVEGSFENIIGLCSVATLSLVNGKW